MTNLFRKSIRLGLAAVAAVALSLAAPTEARQLPTFGDVVKVEQDWEIDVGSPDATMCSPQLFILAYPESGGDYWTEFLINYNDQPQFSAGGVQIQVWQGSYVLGGADNSPNQAVLQTQGERVTFTLSMRTINGSLHFRAKNVSSTSFGNIGNLVTNVPYGKPNLNNYSTADTVANSGILYGANRVNSMILKQVRKYDAAGNTQVEGQQSLYPPPATDAPGGSLGGITGP
jgi:hypothetical protein